MASLLQQITAVSTDSFRYRVAMAMYKVAREAIFELPSIEGHNLRVNFSKGVIDQDYTSFYKYAALVVADPVIADAPVQSTGTDAITDAIIVDCIRRMWNPLSGVV